MSDPENLVLQQLREMRADNARVVESVQACMRGVARMYEQFSAFHDELGGFHRVLAGFHEEFAEFRAETRRSFIKIEGDLIHAENQNMSRHGETLNLMRKIREIEQPLADVSARVDAAGL